MHSLSGGIEKKNCVSVYINFKIGMVGRNLFLFCVVFKVFTMGIWGNNMPNWEIDKVRGKN